MESSNHPLSESWTMWSHLSGHLGDFPGLGLWKWVIGHDLLWARSGIVTSIVLVMITVAWKWGRCRLYIYRSMNVNVHRNGHIYVFVYLSNYVYMYICIRIRICEYIYICICSCIHMKYYPQYIVCDANSCKRNTHTQRRQPDTMISLENRIARIPNMVYHLFVNKIHTTWRSTWGPPLLDKPKSQMKFVIFLSYVSHSHDVAIEWLVQFPVW
jgi:hypothetical protein